jgi:hypothetical protein
MKKIGFITTNRMLGQSLSSAIRTRQDLQFEPFVLHNSQQAILDIEVLKIDIAIIDVLEAVSEERTKTLLTFCKKIKDTSPTCKVLLFLSQDDAVAKTMAVEAVHTGVASDFVFYDASLEYFFAKISAFL